MASTVDEEARYSFQKFASHDFMSEVNRWLVEHVGLRKDAVVVDLGCGPGAVTEIILEHVDADSGALVYGIDPSPSALDIARARIRARIARFLEGTGERFSHLVPPADAVIFCNAIHLVKDKAAVAAEAIKALRPGGIFAFNSTFFEGAYPGDTLKFYKRWVLRAVRHLKEAGVEVSKGVKATAMQWLTPEQYKGILAEVGFGRIETSLQTKPMSCKSFEDISEFSLFIEGALPGVPLELGAKALKIGVRAAFEELQLQDVPRNWLSVIAYRA
jgi:ubiquinone/menaquinone biosynthesis C-methylase UbiE